MGKPRLKGSDPVISTGRGGEEEKRVWPGPATFTWCDTNGRRSRPSLPRKVNPSLLSLLVSTSRHRKNHRNGSSQSGFRQTLLTESLQHRLVRFGRADDFDPCRVFTPLYGLFAIRQSISFSSAVSSCSISPPGQSIKSCLFPSLLSQFHQCPRCIAINQVSVPVEIIRSNPVCLVAAFGRVRTAGGAFSV